MPKESRPIEYDNGDVYRGETDDKGRPHGKGIYTHHDEEDQVQTGTYNGEWKDGQKHGKGSHRYRNGDVYDGPWVNGKRHGKNGKYTYHNKSSTEYVGDWEKDMKQGHGVMLFDNGDKYDGHWKNNNMESDKGTYTHSDGSQYIGKNE